ncbi:MAG: type I methionyl aminopeptidase [Solirubrobacterales bacterium]
MNIRKTEEQIEEMAAAGDLHARCIAMLRSKIAPGVTTAELDEAAERFIVSGGGVPTFKGYRGFPASICTSPNSLVVHGIPGPYELEEGDVISIDVGVTLDGWIADGAFTAAVGGVDPETERLLEVTHQALRDAVGRVEPGNHIGDISNQVQTTVESAGFSIIKSLVGHGIGRSMHEEPQIPNYGPAGKGPEIEAGMVFAIEPMVNAGAPGVYIADDGWSVFSEDGSMAAHFEYTVAATEEGPKILTPWDEE